MITESEIIFSKSQKKTFLLLLLS